MRVTQYLQIPTDELMNWGGRIQFSLAIVLLIRPKTVWSVTVSLFMKESCYTLTLMVTLSLHQDKMSECSVGCEDFSAVSTSIRMQYIYKCNFLG